jgi:hypothetical protein
MLRKKDSEEEIHLNEYLEVKGKKEGKVVPVLI